MNRNRSTRSVLGGLVMSSLLLPSAVAAREPRPARIDELARRAMQRFQVPGMAIGVVSKGRPVYAKGHGVRAVGKTGRVSAGTLFQIASLTKAFTAAALGILVDEGKLDWDQRVIDYLPEFRMHDPWVTRELTIRDLLTHRSGLGLGAGDLLFWPRATSTRAEVIAAMRHLQPESSFRSAYAYDNLLYVVAGEVVAAVSTVAWEDFVESRIMAPLGMDACRSLPDRVAGHPNRAVPHTLVDSKLRPTFFSGGGATAAAGAINCNVTGLAKWAAMHLARGAIPGGKRLLSEKTHLELWRPVTLMPVDDWAREHARTHFMAYALGWAVRDFCGHLLVSHSGGLQGMTSYLALLPEKDVAVIVLSNQWSKAPHAVATQILDAYIRETPADWVEIYASAQAERAGEAGQAVAKAFAARNALSTPSLALDAYAGMYRDAWYGDVFVKMSGKGLVMRFSRSSLLTGTLEHFQYDTFVVRWGDRSLQADAYATFNIGIDGKVSGLEMKAVSPDTDFSFDFHHLDLQRVAEK